LKIDFFICTVNATSHIYFSLFLPTEITFQIAVVLKVEITDYVGESFTVWCCWDHVFNQIYFTWICS